MVVLPVSQPLQALAGHTLRQSRSEPGSGQCFAGQCSGHLVSLLFQLKDQRIIEFIAHFFPGKDVGVSNIQFSRQVLQRFFA